MSSRHSSSAPAASYAAAAATGSPASRNSTKRTPLTTRPSFTSRQGMRRTLNISGGRDGFDFDKPFAVKNIDGNHGRGGTSISQNFPPDFAIFQAIFSVGDKRRDFDNVVERHADGSELGFDIGPGKPALCTKTCGDLIVLVGRDLAADKSDALEAAYFHDLRITAAGRGGHVSRIHLPEVHAPVPFDLISASAAFASSRPS